MDWRLSNTFSVDRRLSSDIILIPLIPYINIISELIIVVMTFYIFLDDSDRSSSKAATVEMYSYANSNNGTVTGETLSSISEKSEQYSDEHSVDDYPVSTS